MQATTLPIAVIGAGPVGLAAAAHLVNRGLTPQVFEAGDTVGASVREWAHVHFFSPWRYSIDSVARSFLEAQGWEAPEPDDHPTGQDLFARYLAPLAAHPRLEPHLHLRSRVVSVTRQGFDKLKTAGREDAPFVLRVQTAAGRETTFLARAVIDASGTWTSPNPLGASGVPAIGECTVGHRIFYGIPDILGTRRARYAGRRVLVVGSGHSAFNALLDLAELARLNPHTQLTWALRRPGLGNIFGGEAADELAARGALGTQMHQLLDSGMLRAVLNFRITELQETTDGILVFADQDVLGPFDEIIATTGFRPDLAFLRELRLGLDPALESPTALAPLIDPNVHSCGTVPPHGATELAHPEQDFYVVGMKSYGRAPTFLLLTGYEQVRSVAAALAGDWVAAYTVELVLPETGVCSSGEEGGCCAPASATPTLLTIGAFGSTSAKPWLARPAQTSQLLPVLAEPSAACCSPTEQATCCEPSDKAECCAASETGSCGCR